MRKTKLVTMGLLAACLTMTAGCETIEPFVSDINIISVQQERELGQQIAAQIATEMKIFSSGTMVDQVQAVANDLVKALPVREFNYQFHVAENQTPNAFAIPGGHIYVHTGLFSLVETKQELAGVLAHEMGHIYERHPAKALTRAYGVNYLSSLILNKNSTGIKTIALKIAQTGILTKYGRDDEREADEIGYFLLKKSGYSSDGLINFLQKIQRMQQDPKLFQLLSTHPPTAERIQNLKALKAQDLSPIKQPL